MKYLTVISFLVLGCSNDNFSFNYPLTREGNRVDVYHGVDVPDPYRWLEDDMSQETSEWVESQNKLTQTYLNTLSFRDNLKRRIEMLNNYMVKFKYNAQLSMDQIC